GTAHAKACADFVSKRQHLPGLRFEAKSQAVPVCRTGTAWVPRRLELRTFSRGYARPWSR
ncbi:MAG: hypothetical protein L6R28_13545, partial [Planctomycetes bacterium]|nr:hypothetical protein [Planctomycetota bacterium]